MTGIEEKQHRMCGKEGDKKKSNHWAE